MIILKPWVYWIIWRNERVLELERQILNMADFCLLGCNMTEEAAEVSFNGIM